MMEILPISLARNRSPTISGRAYLGWPQRRRYGTQNRDGDTRRTCRHIRTRQHHEPRHAIRTIRKRNRARGRWLPRLAEAAGDQAILARGGAPAGSLQMWHEAAD